MHPKPISKAYKRVLSVNTVCCDQGSDLNSREPPEAHAS
jgi:hypothetical protein